MCIRDSNGAVLENDGVTIAKDKNGQELIYNENNELITTVYIEENQKFRKMCIRDRFIVWH